MSTIVENLEKAAQNLADEARREQQAFERLAPEDASLRRRAHSGLPAAPAPRLPQAQEFPPSPEGLPAPVEVPAHIPAEPAAQALVAPEPAPPSVLHAYHDTLHFLMFAALAAAGLHGLAVAAAGWSSGVFEPSIFVLVSGAGALGAFVSALLRLYDYRAFAIAVSPERRTLGRLHKLVYALAPMIIGAVAALAAYLLFAGGVMRGAVFPEFGCGADGAGCVAFQSLVKHFGPSSAADFAKTLLWCFVAGFSERLLPDLLGNFARIERTPVVG
ncbi:MAG: hypothetical protein JWN93_1709 [Hyphomicrobiales bacterium]|nr:hypothetical protein [Hyphomicrobiales bacterium]